MATLSQSGSRDSRPLGSASADFPSLRCLRCGDVHGGPSTARRSGHRVGREGDKLAFWDKLRRKTEQETADEAFALLAEAVPPGSDPATHPVTMAMQTPSRKVGDLERAVKYGERALEEDRQVRTTLEEDLKCS